MAAVILVAADLPAAEGWRDTAPRWLRPGEIPVTGPGNCAEAGKTYVLAGDVTAPASGLFLGRDVTLDLNGYTLTFAAGPYESIRNSTFEEGLHGWDVSQAPHARVEDRRWLNPMVRDHVLVLPQGEELISPYIRLTVPNRPYYAMVAVAHHEMGVDITVEDEQGRPVRCELDLPVGRRTTCPELNRRPKLGGGTVFALVFNQPAGKYRVRVKAVGRDAIIGAVDLLPAMDVGIGMVGDILPWAYYKCVLDGDDCAFFELSPAVDKARRAAAPIHPGGGKNIIRNGVIMAGSPGIRTWGILSTVRGASVEIENVKIISEGINANAIRIPNGTIANCRTEIESNWIIDRHRQGDATVCITEGTDALRITGSEFIGGQGQVAIVKGAGGEISHCRFVNQQRVVNHYSVSACDRLRIFQCRFEPEEGSGILIYGDHGAQVFSNIFRLHSSRPVNEYATTDYSVSAVRLTDYNREPGRENTCYDNRIHHNRIELTGRHFAEAHKNYKPMAYGIFTSVGGGTNYIHDNEFVVDQQDLAPGREQTAYALFIGGSNIGGEYYRNRITANVTPVWISTSYGPAQNVNLHHNAFIHSAKGGPGFAAVKLGHYKHPSQKVGLFSNTFVDLPFTVEINDYTTGYVSAYTVGWTLTVRARPGEKITVRRGDLEVSTGLTGADGVWSVRLPQYEAKGNGRDARRNQVLLKTDISRYRVTVGATTRDVVMDADKELKF